MRSPGNVISEINEIVNDGYKSIIIVDDNFMADKNRVTKIMNHIINNNFNIDILINGARVDSADRKIYALMKKAGVRFISFGIESGNQDVLDYYNKKITLKQIEKTIKLSHELGFITSGNFILGAPIETKIHFENTIKFAKSLPLDIAIFSMLGYISGSPLWNEEVKNGNINPDETFVPADKKRGLGNFTLDELEYYCSKASQDFYNNIPYFFRQFKNIIQRRDISLAKTGIKMLIQELLSDDHE